MDYGDVNRVLPHREVAKVYLVIFNLDKLEIDPRTSNSMSDIIRRSILRLRFTLMSTIITRDEIQGLLGEKILKTLNTFEDTLLGVESENDDLRTENDNLQKINKVISDNVIQLTLESTRLYQDNEDLRARLIKG